MKHTPGPWNRIIADGYTVRHPQIYSDTGPVANATWLGDGRLDELNANARLIAAAPELLSALIGLLECPYHLDEATVSKAGLEATMNANPHQVVGNMSVALLRVRKARAAIAKAGGES